MSTGTPLCGLEVTLRTKTALPDQGVPCCDGSAFHGPDGCTCWFAIYDQEQADPDTTALSSAMPRPCKDCAYRKNSPERTGGQGVEHDEDFLEQIVKKGEPFWCHDGMRQVIAYAHPSGARVDIPPDVAYDPPITAGQPYRADGRPGDLCAGWLARRLAQLQRDIPKGR